MRAVTLVLVAGFFSLLVHDAAAQSANPNALWQIVHGQCVPHFEQQGNPSPCITVNVSRGSALLKDRNGTAQFLLISTRRITGIESPAVRMAGATNYFAAAWKARVLTEARLGHGLPRDAVSLAINSQFGRTQNQLHIHIDCLRTDVRAALNEQRMTIARRWTALKTPLNGHTYMAMRAPGEVLRVNPFRLLADNIPGARSDMGRCTLVVVGMQFDGGTPGFVVLESRADPAEGNYGSGEELQDHDCAIAQ